MASPDENPEKKKKKPTREAGREKKKSSEKLTSINDFPTLVSILEDSEGVEKEKELERRFTENPKHRLPKEQLKQYETRHIRQKFVTVLDGNGVEVTFRLRITRQEGEEGLLYRIARKERTGTSFEKEERQVRLTPTDTDPRTQEFLKLWRMDQTRTIERQRYYIEHTFPNTEPPITCQIHYEEWLGGKEKGFVRIEIEFDNPEDEQYYSAHATDKGILPDWIGEDVTFDENYLAKNITKRGLPKEAITALEKRQKKPKG